MLRMAFLFVFSLFFISSYAAEETHRIPQFSNKQVNVWSTVIAPMQPLKMHHHQYNRVVIALDSGTLKVIPKQGRSHLLYLQKGKAYWLPKDENGKLHADENISKHPIKVIVIEIKPTEN